MGYGNTQTQDVSLYPYSTSGHFLHTGLTKDDPNKFSELNTLNGRISEENYLQKHEIEKRFEKEKTNNMTEKQLEDLRKKIEEEEKKKKFIMCTWSSFFNTSDEIPEENIAKFRLDTHDIVNKYKESFASINIENNSREKPKKYKKIEHFGNKPILCINVDESEYVINNGRTEPSSTRIWNNSRRRWESKYTPSKKINKKVSCKDIGRFKTSNVRRVCNKGECLTTWCCEEPGGSDPQASSCKDYECSKGFSKKLPNTCTPKRYDRYIKTDYSSWTKCTANYKSCKGEKCTDNECCEKTKFYSEPKQKNINSICLSGYDCEVIPVGVILQRSANSNDAEFKKWRNKVNELKTDFINEEGIKFWDNKGKGMKEYDDVDKSGWKTLKNYQDGVKDAIWNKYQEPCKKAVGYGSPYDSCQQKQAWDNDKQTQTDAYYKRALKDWFKHNTDKTGSALYDEMKTFAGAHVIAELKDSNTSCKNWADKYNYCNHKTYGNWMKSNCAISCRTSASDKKNIDAYVKKINDLKDKSLEDRLKLDNIQLLVGTQEKNKLAIPYDKIYKDYNSWVGEWNKELGKLNTNWVDPLLYEYDLAPKDIIIKAGKETNGDIIWSDENITVDLKNIRKSNTWKNGGAFTVLFHPDIRQKWKGHEHIWLKNSLHARYAKLGYRVNLLYGIEGYGKSLEKKL